MAEAKTKKTKVSVSDYIAEIPDEGKRADAKALVKMMQSATGEKPAMWGPSIIGFGSYHYKYETGREGDMPVLAFSPRKSANVLYLAMQSDEAQKMLASLGKHERGKGCLYIKKLADVDQKTLEKLVAHSVKTTRTKYPKAK